MEKMKCCKYGPFTKIKIYRCNLLLWKEENIALIKSLYSMMMNLEKLHHLHTINYVETIGGKLQGREKERTWEKDKRVSDSVLQRKGFGIGHKFDCSSKFSELRDS
jgi:hypothetical protein